MSILLKLIHHHLVIFTANITAVRLSNGISGDASREY